MLKLNGSAQPAPSSMQVKLFDVGNAGRNAAGETIWDRVAVKRKLQLKWAKMSAAQLRALLQAVEGARFFEVEYYDPLIGGVREMECSCGERSVNVLRMDGGAPIWVDVEMVWTER